MSYTKTLPAKMATKATWSSQRNGKPANGEAKDPVEHKARLAFFFLLLLTGLLYGRPADIFWDLQKIPLTQIAAVCAAGAYVIARLQGGTPFVWTTEVRIVFALTLAYAASVPMAFWISNSLDILLNAWMKTLITFFLLTQCLFTLSRVRKILWTIILCELIVATYSLMHTGRVNIDEGDRLLGFSKGIMSGNYLGIAAATTMPYIALLLLHSKSFFQSLLLVSSLGTMTWMVILSASRGGMIGMIIALGLVWLLMLRDSARARMMGVIFVLGLIIGVAFAPPAFWERVGTLWDKEAYATSGTVQSANASEFQRKALLRRSIEYTLQRPFVGWGLGNFSIVSGTMTHNAQEWKGTHNTYTQVSSEAGIPALLLFISLLVVATRNMRRIRSDCGKDPDRAELASYAGATLVSLYVFMFSAFFAHLAYEFHLFYLAAMGAALRSIYLRSQKTVPAIAGTGWNRLRNGRRGAAS